MYKKLFAAIIAGAGMWGCDAISEYQDTDSGLTYSYAREGDGAKPENGDILVMNVSYMTPEGDVIFSTAGQPMSIQYDDSLLNRMGGLEEGLQMLSEGDSLILKYPVEDLFEGTFKIELPDTLTRGQDVTVCLGLDHVFTIDEFNEYRQELETKQREAQMERSRDQMIKDGETIDTYLEENSLEAEVHESGLRYQITEEGSGDYPETRQLVRVAYTGRNLRGEIFDTSDAMTAKDGGVWNPGRTYEPYQFALGVGAVIQGWDIGISLLRPGAKAVLYVPSPLGYGPQALSPQIGANEILIFEVELVEVVR